MVVAVQLAPLSSAHAEATLRWVSDPALAEAIGVLGEPSAERTAEFIERSEQGDALVAFAVLDGGRHVGNVVLDLIDRRLGTARFSIYLGEPAIRGRGVGAAATRAALSHAFGELGLHKVWLTVHERNQAAIHLYEACGFQHEGRLREEFLFGGERIDALRMGILTGEVVPA